MDCQLVNNKLQWVCHHDSVKSTHISPTTMQRVMSKNQQLNQLVNQCINLSLNQTISAHQIVYTGFPLGLENLENLEKWEGIFQSGKSQGILNRLEKSGKSQGKPYKILEN